MELSLYQQYREIEAEHWWSVGRRQLILQLLAHYLPPKSGMTPRILDVGCHTGFLVKVLRDHGYDSYGCDASAEAIAFGRREGIVNLQQGDEGGLPFADGEFDAVLCLDVLEHIQDDSQMLREIRRVTAPDGVIIIMVPALQILWGLQDEVAHHFRRYRNQRHLRQLATAAGLQICRLSYFNSFLFLPILLVRLWQRRFPPTNRVSDFDLNNRVINYLFRQIFLLEIKLLRVFNFFIASVSRSTN